MRDTKTGADRLEALRRREAALKAAIAEEKVRRQKRSEKEDARLCSIVGEALTRYAAMAPDFLVMLKQVLQAAEISESDRAFLAAKGWL